jgi:YcxB-like protein
MLVFPMRVKRDYKKQTQLMGPQLLATSEAGIRFKGDNFESETKWALFGKMRETKRVFMLYVGNKSFEILPKRAFSPSEQAEFRELVSQRLTNQ